MKRRTDCSKFRRPIKKSKIAEGLSSNTLLYLKFFILWAFVIAADHLIEFRFEFLWPFWLLLRSVHDSFKYKGLAFSILFVCIAFTSDLICLFFIPAQWLFFVASTYVWVQFVWHTDRGVCLPTIVLWVIFVYLEAAVRWKDNRSMPHLDLCRPFAAHCIGYPVVTLGFGFKSYVGYRIRQRKQREVAKENDFYMQLLQQALPQEETMPSFSQSDQQLQPQEKDPITVTGNHHQQSSSSGIPSSSSNHQHKNAQNNSSKLLNNNNCSSPVTNGHAIGAAASLLFGLSSSMSSSSNTNSSSSSASTTVISNGVGYNHSTQQISNPSSSSNSNSSSSSSSTRHRKSVDKESSSMMMTSSLSNNSNGGSNGTGGNKNNNSNTFHHISLNNKDRSSVNDNSSTSYDYSSQQNKQTHDKDSPKQQLNSHHYQLSNNSTTNVSNSSYDDAFGKSEPTTKSSNKLQNGNLQHYNKQDFELPQSTCQQQQPEQILCNNNSQSSVGTVTSNEKERTKSGRKGRGNKGNKNPIDPTTSASSSKDNHLQTSSLTTVTNHNQQNNTTSSNVNNNNINNNTQQDLLLFQSQYSLCNNKDHQNKVCESCPKFEVEVKKLKAEINALKQSEIELRQKSETNASNVKSCLQAKQKENDELHSKMQEMTNVRQVERQTMQNLERRLTEERRLRQSLEAQLNNERKYRKQAEEKASRSECTDACRMKKQQLENEVNKIRRDYAAFEEMKHNVEKQQQRYEQELRKMELELRNRDQQQHSDLITLNDLRMKNATLEKNLSAETRVKLDLFSALGESKRDIEMRDSLLREQQTELLDLKAKIAQLLAVMPSMPDSFSFATSMHHDGGLQQHVQQQQSVSPLGHMVLGGGSNGGPSSLVLDPNAKTYTPKTNSSLIGGAEA